MINAEFSKVKHLAAIQVALRTYKAAYAGQGAELKDAEAQLNAAIEKALSPK